MTAHLEAGTCASGMTRASLNARVTRLDQNRFITTPAAHRLLTYGSEPSIQAYTSTSRAWDGSAWACVLCTKRFATQRALGSHLASPKHVLPAGKLYRCPGSGCGNEFNTLSGLVQHVETSSGCLVRRNAGVQDAMRGFVGRTIAYY